MAKLYRRAHLFLLAALSTISPYLGYTQTFDPVTGNAVQEANLIEGYGVNINSNSFKKTAGLGWNAGVSSQQTIDYGFGAIDFTLVSLGQSVNDGFFNGGGLVGLGHSSRDPRFVNFLDANLDYGLGFRNDGLLKVWNRDSSRTAYFDAFCCISYQPGDRFRIAVSDGTLTYYKNGTLFFQQAISAKYPLYFYSAASAPGFEISQITISHPDPAVGNQFHVTPQGTPYGNGSLERPLDLQSALSADRPFLVPGSTIWIHSGTYRGAYHATRRGTALDPIRIRAMPGERVTINGSINSDPESAYLWFWGLEITNAQGNHIQGQSPLLATGLNLLGRGLKSINNVVHDTGHPGIGFWNVGEGGEIYGSLMWGNGIYDSNYETTLTTAIDASAVTIEVPTDSQLVAGEQSSLIIDQEMMKITAVNGSSVNVVRGFNSTHPAAHAVGSKVKRVWIRGDGVYAQNLAGNVFLSDNISFAEFTTGLKGFGETGYFNDFSFHGNTIFRTNSPLFVGGGSRQTEIVSLRDNLIYNAIDQDQGGGITLGYVTPNNYFAEVENNVVAGGRSFALKEWQEATVKGNTFYGNYGDSVFTLEKRTGAAPSNYRWDLNSYYSSRDYVFGLATLVTTSNAFGGGVLKFDEPPRFDVAQKMIGQGWRQWTGFDQTSTFGRAPSQAQQIFIRPNQYEPGRSHIVVYNWALLDQVSIDLKTSGLLQGQSFEVFDAQNFYGSPLLSGQFTGQPVVLSLNLNQGASLDGIFHLASSHTAKVFNAFVVIPKSSPPINTAPITRDQTVTYYRNTPLKVLPATSDPDLDHLIVSILSAPKFGTVEVRNEDARPYLIYTPNQDFINEDSFTYQVSDGKVNSRAAKITLKSATPVRAQDLSYYVKPGETIPIELSAIANLGDTLHYLVYERPSHGMLAPVDTNDTYYLNPNWRYTAPSNFEGEDSFTYLVHSASRYSLVAHVRITVSKNPITAPNAPTGLRIFEPSTVK